MARSYVWFHSAGRKRNFQKAFGKFKGNPAAYLEIGVFRGASIKWMVENVLTHEASTAIGIDPWRAECMGGRWTQELCDENYALAQEAVKPFKNVHFYRQESQDWFRTCQVSLLGAFDAIYLDGQHDYEPLRLDFVAAWPTLKVGGAMIIDDFRARHSEIPALVDEWIAPRYGDQYQELFRNYQIGFEKVA
jgi:predicted O-methyltransferase YrrM